MSKYSMEARLQHTRPTARKERAWMKAPMYPPKARHVATSCDIVRVVETADAAVQNVPPVEHYGVQASACTADASTQRIVKHRHKRVGTGLRGGYSEVAVQCDVSVASKMTETTQRGYYLSLDIQSQQC